jgi:hypothetical protein
VKDKRSIKVADGSPISIQKSFGKIHKTSSATKLAARWSFFFRKNEMSKRVSVYRLNSNWHIFAEKMKFLTKFREKKNKPQT